MQPQYTPEPTKECSKCGKIKPLREFHRRTHNVDGYNGVCKKCRAANEGFRYRTPARDGYRRCKDCSQEFPATSQFFKAHKMGWLDSYCRECSKLRAKARYRADPERHKAITLAARRRNPEIYRAIGRRHYHNNKDKYHLYYLQNRDRHREQGREWVRNNLERARELARRRIRVRLERKAALPDRFTQQDWQRAVDYFDGCCAICGRPPGLFHTIVADHWIPVVDPNCPGTIPANILPLCNGLDGCNNSKSGRPPHDWLVSKFGPAKAARILERIESFIMSRP